MLIGFLVYEVIYYYYFSKDIYLKKIIKSFYIPKKIENIISIISIFLKTVSPNAKHKFSLLYTFLNFLWSFILYNILIMSIRNYYTH